MKKPLLKLIVFLNIFNKSCDEADDISKEKHQEEWRLICESEDFKLWHELRRLCNDIVKTHYDEVINHKQFKAVVQTFNLYYCNCLKMIKEDKEFFHSTFFFNLLQGCDFSEIKSDDEGIKALTQFDFKALYPTIQKYKLINGFDLIKVSQYFKRNYWENLK